VTDRVSMGISGRIARFFLGSQLTPLLALVLVLLGTFAIVVTPREETQAARAMWGMSRTQIDNLVKGVVTGYAQALEIHGVGFRAAMKGKDLQMQLGYSHDIVYAIPEGITIQLDGPKKDSIVRISGIDKQKVGQVAAELRAYRKPEPYQGKGVRYEGEYIQRKEGKKK